MNIITTHDHDHNHSHTEDEETPLVSSGRCSVTDDHAHGNIAAARKLKIAIVLCLIFFLIELIAGIYSNSLALLSDAFHLLTDLAAFAISLISIYLASLPANNKYAFIFNEIRFSFGYYRAEILGALLSTVLIWLLVAGLLYEAVQRISNPQAINAPIMFGASVAGVFM
jgi:zinc transporter 2